MSSVEAFLFHPSITQSMLWLTIVMTIGLWFGEKAKIKQFSLGVTWVLFIGIALASLGIKIDHSVAQFAKDFGLILFVYSIGLQVAPSFSPFKKGVLHLNMLAAAIVLLGCVCTIVIHYITGIDMSTLAGVMSGATTSTPSLAAAQQAYFDLYGTSNPDIATGYAVAYPLGVLGVIFLLIFFKAIFKVDIDKEKEALDNEGNEGGNAIRASYQVCNPALFGMTVASLIKDDGDRFVISRISHGGVVETPGPATVLNEGDNVLVITSQAHEEAVKILFGKELEIPFSEWTAKKSSPVARKITITRSGLTGKKLRELNVRSLYGVTVTRVIRAGVELVANPNLYLQMGDTLLVVGDEEGIDKVARLFGNKASRLSHPNLVPIFFGIVIGVIFGSIPISFPGVPQPVKLGLAGGPLIISILLGYFGPKMKITTYTTVSANMMLREIGISFFLAAVGLGAGANFISAIVNGGYWWILYGFLITVVPIIVTVLVARLALKLNFYQICGLIAGSTTNPPVLAFAQGAYGTDYTSVNYATVYPLSMFMRVLAAQLLILFTL